MKTHPNIRATGFVPQDIERQVIDSALTDGALLAELSASGITPEHFNYPDTKKLFQVAIELFKSRGAADHISVASELQERKDLGGNLDFIANFNYPITSATQFRDYVGRIKSSLNVRKFYNELRVIEEDLVKDGLSLLQREQKMHQAVATMMQSMEDSSSNFLPSHDFAIYAAESFAASKAGKRLQKQKTGIVSLDVEVGGLVPGRVAIIGGRTSHGKTSFATYLAVQQARKIGTSGQVLYFSAEMSHDEMSHRVMSSLSGVSATKIGMGTCDSLESGKVQQAVQEMIDGIRIAVDTSPAPTSTYMMSRAMSENAKVPVKLVIFDYLEYTGDEGRSRDLQLENALRGCHEIAKRLRCPVVVLSQLSREVDKRRGRPELSDLRYTGAAEQIAGLVMFVYHQWTHEQQLGLDTSKNIIGTDPNKYELLIKKNSHGPIGDIDMRFYPETGTFIDPIAEQYTF